MKTKFRLLIVLALLLLLSAVSIANANSDKNGSKPAGPTDPTNDTLAPVIIPEGAKIIPDQYIVILKSQTATASLNSLTNMVEASGGEVEHTYTSAFTGFSAYIPSKDTLSSLQQSPDVALIEADQVMSTVVTWGLDRIDQRNLPLNNVYSPGANGTGVRAYIIDTGIRTTHTDFGGRAFEGYSAIGGSSQDCNGHGTHVAGSVGSTTYGVANNVRLYAVRVLDCNGSGSNSGVIAGIDWVTNNHVKPAVANMSLGGGASSALDTAVNNSINAGVTYVVAAGNDNANACNYSPARVANAITVGSTTNTDARSSFSNYGTCVDIFAPGSNITAPWHTSNTATNTISGTSMASPHVAGAVALYLQSNPNASVSSVTSSLINNATTGKVTNPGTGSPNRLLFVGTGINPTPTPTTTATPTATPPAGTTYTGYLSGTGAAQIQPNGSYYQSTVSGLHKGTLSGPAGTDFDLRLYKWNGSSWAVVASSLGSTSSEVINYNGTAGYYYWRINSYSGSGNYTLVTQRP